MIEHVTRPPQPNRDSTIAAILEASRRPPYLPLRDSFVQGKDAKGAPVPGPLHLLVHRGVDSTIEQFLLHRVLASGGEFDVCRHPIVWQRALGLMPSHTKDDAGRRTVLRNWATLRELRLVATRRRGRLLNVTALAEDGSGRAYRHPGEKGKREDYFKLPFAYWRDGYHERLSVPGKAVLLIALTLGDWFWLPPRHATPWYGLSPSTLQRGLTELYRADALDRRWHFKEAPLTEAGYTREYHWILKPPFGPKGTAAKGAPAELASLVKAKSSPSRQAGRSRRGSKRRKPAARKA